MSRGEGARTTGAGVCAECVRVCEDAIARRMFLLISKSEFICDFLLAKEVATLIVSFPFLYLFYFAPHTYSLTLGSWNSVCSLLLTGGRSTASFYGLNASICDCGDGGRVGGDGVS